MTDQFVEFVKLFVFFLLTSRCHRPLVAARSSPWQDAWRRFQTPASINLGELGEDEWEVIRDTEDEQV